MSKHEKLLAAMQVNPDNVRFSELANLCEAYFGSPRNKGTSHHVYKTPWQGDPRVNIQQGKGGKAKAYQVKQVLQALRKYEETTND